MKEITLNVKNMHCKSCEMLITEALEEMDVKSQADSSEGTVTVSFDENKTSKEKIKSFIKKEGFEVK